MKYEKATLTVDQQVERLCQRGMLGDPLRMAQCLGVVSYYRLSAYWYPFRMPGRDDFAVGTEFDRVWESYVFDRQLRLLAMDAIERIEIAIRTQIVHHHAGRFGPMAYAADPGSLPDLTGARRAKFFANLEDELGRSRERFVEHFRTKYTAEPHLPLWMASEIMSLGATMTLFGGCPHEVRRDVARVFRIDQGVLSSWLVALNTVRNICAHHGRLWNREIGTQPKIPIERKHPEWHRPYRLQPQRVFTMLTIANYCLRRLSSASDWALRWRGLLEEHPRIHRRSMGIPSDWLASPLWDNARRADDRAA